MGTIHISSEHSSSPTFESEASLLRYLGTLSAMTFSDNATAVRMYLTACIRMLNMRTAFVSQFEPQSQRIDTVVNQGGCALVEGATPQLHETFCQYVLASNGPVVIPDAANDVRVRELETRRDLGIGSYIGVPLLLLDGTTYGTLCVVDPEPREFTSEDIALMRVVARYITAILESPGRSYAQQPNSNETLPELDEEASNKVLNEQTRLMQVVAHDVRSPLMIINGYTDLLLMEEETRFTADQIEALEHIQRAGNFINRLINDLMNINTLGQHALSMITEEFNAVTLVQDIVASFQPQAQEQGIELMLECDLQTLHMAGDRDRLRQVLLNLIGNALRYTTEGEVRLGIVVVDQEVEFSVADTGPGIDPELQAQIWECYQRGTTDEKGFGIGLYVVRQLIGAMGGSIELFSEVDQGSRFIVRLPINGRRPQQALWS